MGRGHPLILVWINAAATALVPMYAAQLSSVAEPQPRSFSVWEPGAEGQGAKHLQLKYSSRSCCCWSGNHCSVCGGTFLRMQDTYQRTCYILCIYQEYASKQGRGTILIKHLLSEWIHEIRSLYSSTYPVFLISYFIPHRNQDGFQFPLANHMDFWVERDYNMHTHMRTQTLLWWPGIWTSTIITVFLLLKNL